MDRMLEIVYEVHQLYLPEDIIILIRKFTDRSKYVLQAALLHHVFKWLDKYNPIIYLSSKRKIILSEYFTIEVPTYYIDSTSTYYAMIIRGICHCVLSLKQIPDTFLKMRYYIYPGCDYYIHPMIYYVCHTCNWRYTLAVRQILIGEIVEIVLHKSFMFNNIIRITIA